MKQPNADPISLSHLILNTLVSFPVYAETYLKIQTKQGSLVNFKLNEVQLLLEKIINEIQEKGRLIRLVILKARRKGISTYVSGRFFWKTTTNPNRYAMIITHEPEATDFIFKMHKRFYEHIPEVLKPTERYNNKKMLEFNNENGTGLDSAIRVGTAGKEDFASSQLIHYCHFSEVSKYPKHTCSGLLLSVLQCVPNTPDTMVIMESTAKGVGGEFYDRYWSSRYKYEFYLDNGVPAYREIINEDASEDNIYTSIFIPWYVFSEYQMDVEDNFERTPKEEELVKKYGITDRHLKWRRWCIENQCKGNENLFNQEYPTTDYEAFLSVSDNIFDVQQIESLKRIAPNPKVRYDIHPTLGHVIANPQGKLKVWEEPKSAKYAIGVDVAEGLIGRGDFSCIDVVDVLTGKQVAQWHGQIAPDQLAYILYSIGMRYNKALIVVERNNHGLTVIDRLTAMNYPNLYAETIIEPPHRPRKRYGWLTTKTSKSRIIDNMIAELRDGTHGIQCKETFEEFMFFKQYEDGSMGAEEGRNDDRVMSYAIVKYVISQMPVKQRFANRNILSYTSKSINNKYIPPGAWT